MASTSPAARPSVVLARSAASNTAASLAELVRASQNVWTGAAAARVTPLELAARGGQWWSSMLDRRTPKWHLPHRTVLSTAFAHVHDFSPADSDTDVVPTLVLPPQAGHSSHVVDFAPGQSQLAALLDAGLTRLYAMEWRAATAATRDVTITDYLDVIDRAGRRAREPRRRLPGRLAGNGSTPRFIHTECTPSPRWGRRSTSMPASR